jgi:hypothetical protein
MMNGLECLGTDDVGFDYGALLQAAGGITQYGISAAEEEQAQKNLSIAEMKALNDAVTADMDAANAMAKADVSAQLKSKTAAADAAAAQKAVAAAESAGSGLAPAATKSRAAATDKALASALVNAKAKPQDGYKAALVKAWTTVANKAHYAVITVDKEGKSSKGDGETNWLFRPVIGRIPGYGVLGIGAGVLTGLGLIVKKIFFK